MRLLLSVGLGCAIALSVIGPTAVRAAQSEGSPDVIYAFDIKPQPLGAALNAFALQVSHQILFTPELVTGKTTQGVKGHYTADGALTRVLAGSGLVFSRSAGGMILVSRADGKNGVPTSDAQIGTSSEPTESSRSNSSASEGLEEITVTAQRRVENLNKVPISLTALPQSLMDDLHIQNIADLTSIVPGLEIPPANGMANANMDIGIRGIFSGGNAPTTQIYIDETPIAIRELSAGPSGSFYPDIFDLDRVEVLRGPQGTLFGSSAMGGAIAVHYPSAQPDSRQRLRKSRGG